MAIPYNIQFNIWHIVGIFQYVMSAVLLGEVTNAVEVVWLGKVIDVVELMFLIFLGLTVLSPVLLINAFLSKLLLSFSLFLPSDIDGANLLSLLYSCGGLLNSCSCCYSCWCCSSFKRVNKCWILPRWCAVHIKIIIDDHFLRRKGRAHSQKHRLGANLCFTLSGKPSEGGHQTWA
jgi:hypothetical protein